MSWLSYLTSNRSEADLSSLKFLRVNIGLALFIVFAHGGALAVSIAKPELAPKEIVVVALFSLPVALGVLISGLVALRRPGMAQTVLSLHGYALGASAVAILMWSISVLLTGPGESRLVWSVGFLTAWVGYSIYVMIRFCPKFKSVPRSALYAVTAFALCVDVSVFIRLVSGVA